MYLIAHVTQPEWLLLAFTFGFGFIAGAVTILAAGTAFLRRR